MGILIARVGYLLDGTGCHSLFVLFVSQIPVKEKIAIYCNYQLQF